MSSNVVVANTIDGKHIPVVKVGPGEGCIFTDGKPNPNIKLIWDESGERLKKRTSVLKNHR